MSKHLYWDWTAQQISEELMEVSQELQIERSLRSGDWESITSLENTISELQTALKDAERREAAPDYRNPSGKGKW